MFTIEHDFDATVVTLIDEGKAPLLEDVIIETDEAGATVRQFSPDTEEEQVVCLSMHQLRELAAALNLPEGIYRLRAKDAPE